VSARTIRVLLAFSMVNFVFPSWPAMRPVNVMRNPRSRTGIFSNTNGAGEMVSLQGFNVLDLERIKVKIVQPEECDRILRVSVSHERTGHGNRLRTLTSNPSA